MSFWPCGLPTKQSMEFFKWCMKVLSSILFLVQSGKWKRPSVQSLHCFPDMFSLQEQYPVLGWHISSIDPNRLHTHSTRKLLRNMREILMTFTNYFRIVESCNILMHIHCTVYPCSWFCTCNLQNLCMKWNCFQLSCIDILKVFRIRNWIIKAVFIWVCLN